MPRSGPRSQSRVPLLIAPQTPQEQILASADVVYTHRTHRREATLTVSEETVFSVISLDGRPVGEITVTYLGTMVGEYDLSDLDYRRDEEGRLVFEPVIQVQRVSSGFQGIQGAGRFEEDIVLYWDRLPVSDVEAYEASIASTTDELFTESARTQVVWPQFNWARFISAPGEYVAAVRAVGIGEEVSETITVPAWEEPVFSDASFAESISIDASATNVWSEEGVFLSATVDGTGAVDQRVIWGVTSGEGSFARGTMNPYSALIEMPESGSVEVTVTSQSNIDLTETITLNATPPGSQPPAPNGLRLLNTGTGTSALALWEGAHDEAGDSYRIYCSEQESDLLSNPAAHTRRERHELTGLTPGTTYHVGVRAESLGGIPSELVQTTFTPSAEEGGALPIGTRVRALPSLVVAPDGSTSVDLKDYVWLTPTTSAPLQPGRWNEVDVEIEEIGGSVSVAVSGSVVTATASASASDTGSTTFVLIRLEEAGRVPLYLSLAVTLGNTTGKTEARNAGGFHYDGPISLDAASFAGSDPQLYSDATWSRSLSRRASEAAATLSGDTLQVDPERSSVPQVLAWKGEKGISTLIIGTEEGAPPPLLPQLPVDTIKYEDDQWQSLDLEAVLTHPSRFDGAAWQRVVANSGLYDVSPYHTPKPVYYEPPVYWGSDHFFNEELYPDDAYLDREAGRVIYSGGHQGPQADPSPPDVKDVSAHTEPGRTVISWRLEHPTTGEEISSPTIAKVRPNNTTATPIRQGGAGSVTLENLDSRTTYECWFFEENDGVVFTTADEKATARLQASLAEDENYEYIYHVEHPELLEWTDPFGTTHKKAKATVVTPERPEVHTLSVQTTHASQEITIEPSWRRPNQTLTYEREMEIGRRLAIDSVEEPRFGRTNYQGERSQELPYNVYNEGVYEAVLEGHLPPMLEGELEEYATAVFVGPEGEEVGSRVELSYPTELALRVRVRASDSQSPVIYGVRVVRS